MKTFVTIFLAMIFTILLIIVLTSCKGVQTIAEYSKIVDSTDTNTEKTTVTKDSSNYRYEVLLHMLHRAQTTIGLTRNQVDSLFTVLQMLPRGTSIIKNDPKLQAQISILLDSMGVMQLTCISNERYYTSTISEQTRYIKELETKLRETTSVTTDTKTEIQKPKKGFWQTVHDFFRIGGTWLVLLVLVIVFILVKRYIPRA